MVHVATATDIGTRKRTNEDACCVEAARTEFGTIALAVVCDGVGGYAKGEVASTTVVHAFVKWFECELPLLLAGMAEQGQLNFEVIKAVWEAMLLDLNGNIRSYGVAERVRLGTTFTGLLACGGRYLVGHVGDCRALRISQGEAKQITEDQTLANRLQANGETVSEEQASKAGHTILQSVGTQRVLRPAFYRGSYAADDTFVLCCDGAWKRAGNDGIAHAFGGLISSDEDLRSACSRVIDACKELGESDNITIVALSHVGQALSSDDTAGGNRSFADKDSDVLNSVGVSAGNDSPTVVLDEQGNDSPTVVLDEQGNDSPTVVLDELGDDSPTVVLDELGDDSPTLVFEGDEA